MDNSRIHKSIRSHASQGKENEIAQFYSVPYFDIGFEFKGSYIAQNVDSFVQKLILSCCWVKNRSLTPNVHKCIKICIIIGFLSSEWNSTILTLSAFNIIILKFFFSFKNYSNDNEMLKQKKTIRWEMGDVLKVKQRKQGISHLAAIKCIQKYLSADNKKVNDIIWLRQNKSNQQK